MGTDVLCEWVTAGASGLSSPDGVCRGPAAPEGCPAGYLTPTATGSTEDPRQLPCVVPQGQKAARGFSILGAATAAATATAALCLSFLSAPYLHAVIRAFSAWFSGLSFPGLLDREEGPWPAWAVGEAGGQG